MKTIMLSFLLGMGAMLTFIVFPLFVVASRELNKLASDDPTVYAADIAAFEKQDNINPPPENAILFAGSSSIRFWFGLEKDFAPYPVIKRGFGGAKLKDLIYYADRIIVRYQPRVIVLFAGTNDICGRPNDKSAEQAFADFTELAALIREKLPETTLLFLPVTPTTSRWNIWPEANRFNMLVKEFMRTQAQMIYIETTHQFLNANQLPKKELLWYDGVHLNSDGYKLWKELLLKEIAGVYNEGH